MNLIKLMTWFNPGRWALYLSLALSLWLGYQAWAHHQREIGREEVRAEFAAQAKATDAKRAAVAAPIAQANQVATAQIRTITKTILKEVPVYVAQTECTNADGAVALSGAFRVFHDAAADGELPDAARVPDAAPVAIEDVDKTVAANYGACLENARQLTDLQQWIREQQALK